MSVRYKCVFLCFSVKPKKALTPGNAVKTVSASNTPALQQQTPTASQSSSSSSKCSSAPTSKTIAARIAQQVRNAGFSSPPTLNRASTSVDNIPTPTTTISHVQHASAPKAKTSKSSVRDSSEMLAINAFKTPSTTHATHTPQRAPQNTHTKTSASKTGRQSPVAPGLLGTITSTSFAFPTQNSNPQDRFSPGSYRDAQSRASTNSQPVTPLPSLFGHATPQVASPVKGSSSAHNSSAESDDIPLSNLAAFLAERANQSQLDARPSSSSASRSPQSALTHNSAARNLNMEHAFKKPAQQNSRLRQEMAGVGSSAQKQKSAPLAHTSLGPAQPRRTNTSATPNQKRRNLSTSTTLAPPTEPKKAKMVNTTSGSKNIPRASQGVASADDDYQLIMNFLMRNPSAAASFTSPPKMPAASATTSNSPVTSQHSQRVLGAPTSTWMSAGSSVDSSFQQRPSCAFAGRSPMASASTPNFNTNMTTPGSPANHLLPHTSPRLPPTAAASLPQGWRQNCKRTTSMCFILTCFLLVDSRAFGMTHPFALAQQQQQQMSPQSLLNSQHQPPGAHLLTPSLCRASSLFFAQTSSFLRSVCPALCKLSLEFECSLCRI